MNLFYFIGKCVKICYHKEECSCRHIPKYVYGKKYFICYTFSGSAKLRERFSKMRNIRIIFFRDVKNIFKNFFALVITIGLCALPALYAWFNIYANWDPYANTGNINIAVVSLDEGYTQDDGEKVNMGDEIVDSLKESTSIGWVFLDDEDEAVNGVTSGEYYAAVVIDADFSSSMYEAYADNFQNPRITYYENEKTNAIATKITDTAVESLQTTINEAFIKVVTSKVFEATNELSDNLSEDEAYDAFIEKMKEIQTNLDDYGNMVSQFEQSNASLTASVTGASNSIANTKTKMSKEESLMQQAQADLANTKTSLSNFSTQVQTTMDSVQTNLNNMANAIDVDKLGNDTKAMEDAYKQALKDGQAASDNIEEMIKIVGKLAAENANSGSASGGDTGDGSSTGGETSGDSGTSGGSTDKTNETFGKLDQSTIDQMNQYKDNLETLQTALDAALELMQQQVDDFSVQEYVTSSATTAKKAIQSTAQSINNVRNIYTTSIVPQMSNLLTSLDTIMTNANDLIDNLNTALGDMDLIFDGVTSTVDNTNNALGETNKIITNLSERLETMITGLESVGKDERAQKLVELLAGDPETYGEFFSEPVKVDTIAVYPVGNYGSAVAPFYTALGIWVGGIFLVALYKVKVDDLTGLTNVKSWQLFFGRFLLFFVLGQVQAFIIVVGDIYLLGVQCLYPGMMFFAAASASLAFTLLNYSLTITFGDVGKAIGVVILVLQIAGSSGTFPIELLPDFYRHVYLFLPFPYAINAMRECVGGIYANTYGNNLAMLLIFDAAALFIGLVVRIPLVGLNHYMEKRMEDTKMM